MDEAGGIRLPAAAAEETPSPPASLIPAAVVDRVLSGRARGAVSETGLWAEQGGPTRSGLAALG